MLLQLANIFTSNLAKHNLTEMGSIYTGTIAMPNVYWTS